MHTLLLTRHAVVRRALAKGVFPSTEHLELLRRIAYRSVIDVGANRGQFAVLARSIQPKAHIISFEPLSEPAAVFEVIFAGEPGVDLYRLGLGDHASQMTMRITEADDSSSILAPSEVQIDAFPKGRQIAAERIQVVPLDGLDLPRHQRPILMKVDVQGYEANVLSGASVTLSSVRHLLVELSFKELYRGQTLASDVIAWLLERDFLLRGVTNVTRGRHGRALQADFLFENSDVS